MKASICITVKNEEKSIASLLDSLINQTIKADEIVIVDGESSDKTIEIIRHYKKKNKNIKLLVEKGGIAHGRNTAIEIARNPIIAQIDADCIAHKDWLEKILEPFKHQSVGVSAGFYTLPYISSLQQAMTLYLGIHPKRFNPETFLPSARSVAFRKSVWESVGGNDEKLVKGADDTKFFISCVKNKIRITRVGDAKVIWQETKQLSLKDFFLKVFNYASGDAKTKIWIHPTPGTMSHNIKIVLVYLRYIILFSILLYSFSNPPFFGLVLTLIFLYFFWSIWKFRDISLSGRTKVFIPLVQIISDFAVMAGFISGLIK